MKNNNIVPDDKLEVIPPFIWPESRIHTKQRHYSSLPPFESFIANADLINGVLVGVTDQSIHHIIELTQQPCRMLFVVVLYPGGPTRASHLKSILKWQIDIEPWELHVRLLPVSRLYEDDYEKMVLPPTIIQACHFETKKTTLCIGSVGDIGLDPINPASFNVVFQPDDALRDKWRNWFQYLFSRSAPLTSDTACIPHLVPAIGDLAAAVLWKTYQQACQQTQNGSLPTITVDENTGEVVTVDGKPVDPWDSGETALDPLAQKLQEIYAHGYLVTVDETTRIKPLTIPVKATLLGQQAERAIGAIKQKQSFTLQVLDDEVEKAVEKCRKVTDLMDLLSYMLSQGNRWIPEKAKELLDDELEERNQKGLEALREALGGDEVSKFIEKRRAKIRKDLDAMYQELGQGSAVPEDKVKVIFDEIQKRLNDALTARITPSATYNRISPTDLTQQADDKNWSQPLALLLRSARLIRESLTDSYFPRRFSAMSFTQDKFIKSMDIFGDMILKKSDLKRAREELSNLQLIENQAGALKEKCNAVWQIIFHGDSYSLQNSNAGQNNLIHDQKEHVNISTDENVQELKSRCFFEVEKKEFMKALAVLKKQKRSHAGEEI